MVPYSSKVRNIFWVHFAALYIRRAKSCPLKLLFLFTQDLNIQKLLSHSVYKVKQ